MREEDDVTRNQSRVPFLMRSVSRRLIFTNDMTFAKLVRLTCGSFKRPHSPIYPSQGLRRPRRSRIRKNMKGCRGFPKHTRWWVNFVLSLDKLADRMAE